MYALVDEMFLAGEIMETSQDKVHTYLPYLLPYLPPFFYHSSLVLAQALDRFEIMTSED